MSTNTEPMRVLVTQKPPDKAIDKLREAVGQLGILSINPDPNRIWSKDELLSNLGGGDFNALYAMLTNKIDADVFAAAPNLKIVANMAVGYNNVDVEEA